MEGKGCSVRKDSTHSFILSVLESAAFCSLYLLKYIIKPKCVVTRHGDFVSSPFTDSLLFSCNLKKFLPTNICAFLEVRAFFSLEGWKRGLK